MKLQHLFIGAILATSIVSCGSGNETAEKEATSVQSDVFPEEIKVDRFADIQVLRYEIKDFDKLSLDQKKLVYYMAQAGLAGRDIIYHQNFKHNLEIRKALETIVASHDGDKENENWKNFLTYTKQVWFANGIHHHYGMDKFQPKFDRAYLAELAEKSKATLSEDAMNAIFDPEVAVKRKVKDPNVDMIVASANNFYGEGVTQKMVEDYYKNIIDPKNERPIEYGLNSTMILDNGELQEDIWKLDG
ncbi:MAG: dihydrofolate reductase, partial [Crocinitomicaceae bacterium]